MSWRFKRTNLLFPLIVSFAVAFVTTANADILHVPGDYPTIQEAIDAAMDGDEVEVHPGTYRELINFLGKSITVRSSDGPEVTIINGDLDDDGFGNGTVVTCSSAEGPDSVLEGFTITGGNDCSGGGMRNAGSSPTVMNCTFTGNNAWHGGGMFNIGGSPTVTNCVFTENLFIEAGSGMYNEDSSPTVTNCTFTDNWAIGGGAGMLNDLGSHPIVKSCTFSGNTAIGSGSAMVNIDDSNPTVTDCTFSGNVGQGFFGGAMLNSGSNPVVTNCTFSGNLAGGFGGGEWTT